MKNTHLEHPEDSILTGDLSVLDWFLTESSLSVKMDGAPDLLLLVSIQKTANDS